MSEARKLAISVTINLGNNENLHLEVSDSAETIEDASSLRRYLASVLDEFGTNDAETRAAVEQYKARVLAEAEVPAEPEDEEDDDTAFSDDIFGGLTDESDYGTETEPAPSEKEDEDMTPFTAPMPSVPMPHVPEPAGAPAEPESPHLQPAPVVEEVHEEFVCCKCGAPVTKLQRDISMLFNNKILCKECMK